MPWGVQERVEGLPVYSDGLQCQLQPDSYRYIARGLVCMGGHWQAVHAPVASDLPQRSAYATAAKGHRSAAS